eukprot:TRINITY_DN19451_c0_g1_i2.p1 TRINITY_DN19451_c0_g1~~TRINITY_DN19451_c0_g1_i2.p1  ORF type:complete len:164 (+),score=29.27 TRINITY_DN19451_c0_g1_i2:25-492(+)
MKVFILAGQSNMVGRAEPEHLPQAIKDATATVRIRWMNNLNFGTPGASDGWQPLQCQFSPGPNVHHFGPEFTLAVELQRLFPEEQIHLLKFAMGSTNLHTNWSPTAVGDAAYFAAFVKFCEEGLAELGGDARPSGLFWLQGESDSGKVPVFRFVF